MRLINIIQTLQTEGHEITYRVRSDGGLIIKSIDGKKFSSLTEGNRVARSMVVGGELSEARRIQTEYNVQKYIKLKEYEHKAKGSIDEVLTRKLKEVQRLWRKRGVVGQGRISKKKLRWYIKTEGSEKALQYLESREKYARGIANDSNVEFLCQRLLRLTIKATPQERHLVEALVEDIRQLKNSYSFLEKWIEPCNRIAYDKSMPIEDKVNAIRNIIGIVG